MHAIPYQVHPLFAIFIFLLVIIGFQLSSEYWVIRILRKVFLSPFGIIFKNKAFFKVLFKDSFLGDQLVSIVIVLTDFEFVFCFFLYDAWFDTCKEQSLTSV